MTANEQEAREAHELVEQAAREKAKAMQLEQAAETKAKERAANEAILQQQKAEQVLEIDAGRRRVRVKRKNGKVVWVEFDDVDEEPVLKALVADFKAIQRAARLNRGGVG